MSNNIILTVVVVFVMLVVFGVGLSTYGEPRLAVALGE